MNTSYMCVLMLHNYNHMCLLGAHNSVMSPIKEIIAESPNGFKNTGFLDVCKTKTEFETSFNDSRKL